MKPNLSSLVISPHAHKGCSLLDSDKVSGALLVLFLSLASPRLLIPFISLAGRLEIRGFAPKRRMRNDLGDRKRCGIKSTGVFCCWLRTLKCTS